VGARARGPPPGSHPAPASGRHERDRPARSDPASPRPDQCGLPPRRPQRAVASKRPPEHRPRLRRHPLRQARGLRGPVRRLPAPLPDRVQRMKRLSPFHRELVWALLLLFVVVLAPFLPAPAADPGSNTWSVLPRGKKVLWTLALRIFGDVRRQTGALVPADAAATLCILGPARHPDAAEWQKLYAWVAAGNTLVFAAPHDDPAVSLGPFGLRIRPGNDTRSPLVLDEARGPAPPAPIAWESGAWIEGEKPGDWVPIRSGSRPVAVFQQV